MATFPLMMASQKGKKQMEKYKIYYCEEDLNILVAQNLAIDECRKLISRQKSPQNYKIVKEKK